ncbi:glutathione S-transferase [Zychaea mexicana]|uniref:glutathione S-transferase n=1 Tax=Zychaea mexicana TaxID=64656 RepID=UPI0022FE5B66|nr:glutathione S-transferase [Zychaea mexicana]KAI9495850.1 glutathione S-transferase [Zychaea mexicana]
MTGLTNLKYYYFDLGTQGRGEPARLLLHDADVSFEDIRIEFKDWLAFKNEIIEDYPAAALPLVKTGDGEYYGLTAPLMRFLGQQLGYDAVDKKKSHFVDQTADFVSDWFQDCIRIFFQPDQQEVHDKNLKGIHCGRMERMYGRYNEGPYLLGEQITYADFMVYAAMRQDKVLGSLLEKDMPNLFKFVQAFENRKNLKEYITSLPTDEPQIVIPVE